VSKIVTIFGGSGFIGSYVTKILSEHGFLIKIITPDVNKANKLKVFANPGHITVIEGDIFQDQNSFNEWIQNSNIVINLVGSFKDKDENNFTKIHSQLPEKIAIACKKYNIEKFIHVSDLNVENIPTTYAKSRFLGEKAALSLFERSIILKSGLVFGQEDNFISTLYNYAKKFSCLPILDNGKNKLQPIYVVDLAKAILNICSNIESYNGIYRIAGKEILSLKEIYQIIGNILGEKICMIPASQILTIMAIRVMNFRIMTPFNRILFGQSEPPFYSEQLKMLNYDSFIVNSDGNLLNTMPFETKTFEENLTKYLK
jgi:nucleoside-diphosphate-sugar epimerase